MRQVNPRHRLWNATARLTKFALAVVTLGVGACGQTRAETREAIAHGVGETDPSTKTQDGGGTSAGAQSTEDEPLGTSPPSDGDALDASAVTPTACAFEPVPVDSHVDWSANLDVAPVSERFGLCSSGGWCWVNPMPHGHDLHASWATSADDLWAVTAAGGLVRWRGGEWSTVSTGIGAHYYAVWGSSADDIWAVGAEAGSVTAGIVAHFDGATWSIAGDGFSGPFLASWGSGPDDVWAVGVAGVTAHWDGAVWSEPSSGAAQNLTGVWGSGPSDVWAVGTGTVVHWDGSGWSAPQELGDNVDLEDVWGSGPSDVWAVGHGYQFSGTLHYDGATWSEVNTIENVLFYDVWGSGPADVWAVGFVSGAEGSAVAHWDGSSWSLDAEGSALGTTVTNDIFRSLTGTAIGDVWAVGNGGTVIHHDGGSWSRTNPTTLVDRTYFTGVWSNSASDAWAVGNRRLASQGGAILHWDGQSWTSKEEGLPEATAINGVWSDGDDVWVVGEGEGNTVLRYDGAAWSVAYESEDVGLSGLWGTGEGDLWVYGGIFGRLGSRSSTLVHWDGSEWTSMTLETRLVDMWGSGANDVWAVGDDTILHWDGASWETVTSCTQGVSGVWGTGPNDVWVTGAQLLHWDGSRWTSSDLSLSSALWGTGPDDIWAVSGGDILHFDGETWSQSPSGTAFSINDISGSGADDVWLVGEEGLILHH